MMPSFHGLFFLLIGTCGAFGNALLVVAYFTSNRSLPRSELQLGRMSLFIGIHEFSYALYVFDRHLLAIASIATGCVMQVVALKVSNRPETASARVLARYFPDNEGADACGKIIAILVVATTFLLLATPLRELPIWHKLLFTVPTPIWMYFAISLITMPRAETGKSRRISDK
jgi:hypothetical protein